MDNHYVLLDLLRMRDGECPECGYSLTSGGEKDTLYCEAKECGFFIKRDYLAELLEQKRKENES